MFTMKNNDKLRVSKDVLNEQMNYITLLKPLLVNRFGENPVAHVHTFGCQGNVADSERMKGLLSEMGFSFVDSPENADLILFNTCAIRETAEDRVFGNVGAVKIEKQKRPNTIIALCGCMMQQEHIANTIYERYPFVNLVFGTHVIHKMPELLFETITSSKRVFDIPDMDGIIAEGLPVMRSDSSHAWVPIMYGCNNFCSYCVVPHVRGRERSRAPEDVLKEVLEVIGAGYGEITLLGQNVNSYGNDFNAPYSFSKLLRKINELDGDFRIKFLTSHPKDCSHELIDTMAECGKVAKHLHLPVQSGNDRVLMRMNRKYTRKHYLDLVHYAKEKIPNITLTSDIIVGFPSEMYEEFLDTVSLIEEVRFPALFTYIFSPRHGTPAMTFDDVVSREEKGKWFQELLAVQDPITFEEMDKLVGTQQRILIDKTPPKNGEYAGKSDGGMVARVASKTDIRGKLVLINVGSVKRKILYGDLLK